MSYHYDQQVIDEALAILESRQRHLGQTFTHPNTAADFLRLKMGEYEREVFAVMLLDNQHRLLAAHELFRSTVDQTAVHPRELVKLALHANASAVIVAHNHPSGAAEPSRADAALTRTLREALALIDVRLLDHFIVTAGNVVSLAQLGML